MATKVYIGGQVTGLHHDDYRGKFREKQLQLEEQGHDVYNPVELVLGMGEEKSDYSYIMKLCLGWMCECDEVHFLHNWTNSNGAILEHDTAQRLGMKIVYPL